MKRLSLRYWLLVLTIMFFYNGIFPFIADARYWKSKRGRAAFSERSRCHLRRSKFVEDKYDNYTQREAAYVAGAVYDSSLVLSAGAGVLIVSVAPIVGRGRAIMLASFSGSRGSAGDFRRGLCRTDAAGLWTAGLHLCGSSGLHHLAGGHLLLCCGQEALCSPFLHPAPFSSALPFHPLTSMSFLDI